MKARDLMTTHPHVATRDDPAQADIATKLGPDDPATIEHLVERVSRAAMTPVPDDGVASDCHAIPGL